MTEYTQETKRERHFENSVASRYANAAFSVVRVPDFAALVGLKNEKSFD
jgi:hypothetical protein